MNLLVEEITPGSGCWHATLLNSQNAYTGVGSTRREAIGHFFEQNCKNLYGVTIVDKDPTRINNIKFSATSC